MKKTLGEKKSSEDKKQASSHSIREILHYEWIKCCLELTLRYIIEDDRAGSTEK